MFRALRHLNFRRFLLAQAFAMTGHWVLQIALGWMVFRLTNSAFYLGLFGVASLVPSLLLSPIAGVVADTVDRRSILLTTQSLSLGHSLILVWVSFTGSATLPLLLGLALLQGVIQGFDWTNRQSIIAQLVDDPAVLPNAIALNSTTFNLARIVGPSLAGATLVFAGEAACFLFVAVSEAAALLLTRRLRRNAPPPSVDRTPFVDQIRLALEYARREPAIRRNLALVGLASACILPYATLLPVFATQVYGGGADLLGLLSAAPAVGAVLGGLLLASRKDHAGLTRRIFIAGLGTAAATLLFANTGRLSLGIAALVLLGCAQISWIASRNTHLQTTVTEAMRGRVMSFFNMAFMAAMPVGQLVLGYTADRFGIGSALSAGAVAALVGHLWLHRALLP